MDEGDEIDRDRLSQMRHDYQRGKYLPNSLSAGELERLENLKGAVVAGLYHAGAEEMDEPQEAVPGPRQQAPQFIRNWSEWRRRYGGPP